MKLTKLFREFLATEQSSGIILIVCTLCSLFIVNFGFETEYLSFWEAKAGSHSIAHWINDGLMAIFFLLIGLELEREIYKGELSNLKNALLPIIAAIGGVCVPALIYFGFNKGLPTVSGIGIPMATDIAFAIGALSLLGSRVPASLKIFLTALAVIDDLIAIIVIAVFYTSNLVLVNLAISLGILGILLILNRLKVYTLLPYLIGGVIAWYFMLKSGVHATISGVLLAFVIPFGSGEEDSPSYKLQHFLHKPVAYFILPVFALANTAIVLQSDWQSSMVEPYALGIILGLVLGKPIGITLFTWLSMKLKITKLPKDLNIVHIIGMGCLAGIGFTMSIFVTLLAFDDAHLINNAKFKILIASTFAGIIGYIFLRIYLTKEVKNPNEF